MNKISLCVLLFVFSIGHSQQLPQFFSDNMVMQQNDTVPIWGFDKPKQEIQINTSWGANIKTITDDNGKWRAFIPTIEAGGPHQINIQGSDQDTINNVLLGEVWLAAGQSNMNIPLKGYFNTPIVDALEAISEANNPEIRFFNVIRNPTLSTNSNVDGEWKVSNSENAMNFSAVAYFFAEKIHNKLNVPVGIITSSWGGSKIQAWLGKNSIRKFSDISIPEKLGESAKDKRTTPTSLYNGMLSPFHDYSIKGFLWYQGESDRETINYQDLFTELIDSWRLQWHDSALPFYFVQIAPFSYEIFNPVKGGDAARLREAQLQTYLNVSGTGMVVTTDIGDCKDVHPSQKKKVGERLAYWALANTYNIPIPHKSPVFKRAVLQERTGEVKVYFDHAPLGFLPNENLKGFYLSEDGINYQNVPARTSGDGTILLSAQQFLRSKYIQYGYGDCIDTDLKNIYGLPAAPFRSTLEVE